jgi:hypothetical protein
MNRTSICIIVLLLIQSMLSCKRTDSVPVEGCFLKYKTALLEGNGAEAAEQASKGTLAEYQKYRDWAVSGSESEIRSLSTIDKFQVILLRQRIDASVLTKMSGADVFKYAIENGWIGKDSVRIELKDISVSPPRATARVAQGNKATTEMLHFVQENNIWKIDLLPTLKQTDQVLKETIRQKGVSEEDFIFSVVETLSGRTVTQDIWKQVQ